MAVTAQSVIDQASFLLNDVARVHWTIDELVGWVNSAQMEIMKRNRGATSERKTFTMTAAAKSLQTIPVDCFYLLTLERVVDGPALREVNKATLDARPNWTTQTGVPKYYAYNDDVPNVFYINPAPTQDTQVEGIFAIRPTVITAVDKAAVGNLTVLDIYKDDVLNYVMYRAFSKDSEMASMEKAAGYQKAFYG